MKKPQPINLKEFMAFKATLPEDIREEWFRWLVTSYCIPRALYLIQREKLEPKEIEVAAWAKAMGLAGPRKDPNAETFTINILSGVDDDDAMTDNIKPTEFPLIIVEHTFKDGRKKASHTLIIDGNKRLRKAFLTGIQSVKAYYLPDNLAKLIRNV